MKRENARTRITTASAIAEINITPMIDVLLVLLIIFMVVTPVAQRAIDTALPQPAPKTDAGPVVPPLVLEVQGSGLLLNRTPVASLEDLESRLRSALEGRVDKTLFVKASGDVVYGRVVEALDVARGAGVEKIGIMGPEVPGSAAGVAAARS